MNGLTITLYVFEALVCISALGILFVKNIFHAALLLMICLLALAGVFVLYNAEFIAVTQILIYAGGILVLIIFGIMLTARMAGKPLAVTNQYVFSAAFMAMLLGTILIKLFSEQKFYQTNSEVPVSDTIRPIGISLMSDYAFPFEIAGVVLLIALLGAAVTASSFHSRKQ